MKKGSSHACDIVFPNVDRGVLEERLARFEKEIGSLCSRYKGKIADLAAGELAAVLGEFETCLTPLFCATTMAEAQLAADSTDSDAVALLRRCETLWVVLARDGDFLEREIIQLSGQRFSRTVEEPDLAGYVHYLGRIRDSTPGCSHPDVTAALGRIDTTPECESLARTLLDRISVPAPENGEIGLGAALPVLYSESRQERGRTVEAISTALQPEVEIRAATLGMLAKIRVGQAEAIGADDWSHPQRVANQINATELSTLLTAVRAERETVHHYYEWKSRMLGHELTEADRYAPLPGSPAEVSWDQACELVLHAFTPLGQRFTATARDLIDRGSVDPFPRNHKQRGALTFSLPDGSARVLLNFTGKLRDVLVLGHELGHAVHTRLSARQTLFNSAVPEVLAETVALFTESLVADSCTEMVADQASLLAFLGRKVEDQLVAVFRQVSLHDFEHRVHLAVAGGERPGADDLGAMWLQEQRALYGSAVTLSDGYRHWWSYLDNFFFRPGAGYAYAYGQVAAFALLARLRAAPAEFAGRFERMLEIGGGAAPTKLLAECGLPLDRPEVWSDGLAVLSGEVLRLCDEVFPNSPIACSSL